MRVTSVPVQPDADTAAQWAAEELARDEYTSGDSGLLRRFLEWVQDLITGVGDGVGGALSGAGAIAVVAIGLAIVALAVWLVVGPMRRSRQRPRAPGLADEPEVRASELERRARAAMENGQWDAAVIEAFRALARRLDERGVIVLRPGLTAHEAAFDAGARRPDLAPELAAHADLFDGVRYGHETASEASVVAVLATLRAVDARARTGER